MMAVAIQIKIKRTVGFMYAQLSLRASIMDKWIFLTLLLVAVAPTLGETEPASRISCPELDGQFGNRWIETYQVGSWEECGTLCSADENCNLWTWDARYETCFLYDRGSLTPCDDAGVCFSGERGCPAM